MKLDASRRKYLYGSFAVTMIIGLTILVIFAATQGNKLQNDKPILAAVPSPSSSPVDENNDSINTTADTKDLPNVTPNSNPTYISDKKNTKENPTPNPSDLRIDEPYGKLITKKNPTSKEPEFDPVPSTMISMMPKREKNSLEPKYPTTEHPIEPSLTAKPDKTPKPQNQSPTTKPAAPATKPAASTTKSAAPTTKSAAPATNSAAPTVGVVAPVTGGLLWTANVAGVIDDSRIIPCGGLWDYYPQYFGSGRKFYALEQYCAGSMRYLDLKKGDRIGIGDRVCSVVGTQDLNYNSDTIDDVDWSGANVVVQTCYRDVSGPVKVIRFSCS